MNKVIACIDGSRSSLSVCDHAAWAARRLDSPLTLLHVVHNPHAESQKDLSGNLSLGGREALLQQMVETEEKRGKLIREQGRAILTDALERVKQAGIADPGSLLRNDRVTEALDELQEEARLLVVGKQGQDGDKVARHIGSHLESIIRTVKRAVLVCPLEFTEPQRFMIAYDGSSTAHTVVERVAQSPMLKGLEAHLLMVGEDSGDNRAKLDNAHRTLENHGFTVKAVLQPGEVCEQVCAYRQAHDIHLLAMGAYGHSRLRQFFVGSTTTKMIMNSPIALLILR
ncbi:universal stress protein [Ectothiorhodospira lacustris]|uniref:universal stress protein n=1 Tax=Ectothiorhodospira lacustris TaxID=2899127 RepID=UPI001EE95149|nr:universal stress protein [Ectothiorhodospira lacustris]MCG5501097.1 universal stress protein [Ectothiorhodospira lacustris]MCG5511200.1 universal stress protein [Ectothiorhodospira lacustris]MCG5522864.1 universal stress protein [Ectothiorhodospira lacustris]